MIFYVFLKLFDYGIMDELNCYVIVLRGFGIFGDEFEGYFFV